MVNNVLQSKLEKFVGFKEVRFDEPPHEVIWIEDKDGHMFTNGVPDLVNDLNAQAKYIYTKLEELGYEITKHIDFLKQNEWDIILFTRKQPFIDSGNIFNQSESLAFALACEKLIDGLEKK